MLLQLTHSCLQTQGMETEKCQWEILKARGHLFSSGVVQWMMTHQNCKNRPHLKFPTGPLLSKWLSGTWIYRKAQKSLGIRGTLSNIQSQVNFATPGTYCELKKFSDFWYIYIYIYTFSFFLSFFLSFFFCCGAATQRGSWPPHSWCFYITHNDAPQSVGHLWTSDQLVTETST